MDDPQNTFQLTDPRIIQKEKKKTTFTSSIPKPEKPKIQQQYKPPPSSNDEEREFDPLERERYWDLIWKKIVFAPRNKLGDIDTDYYQNDKFMDVRPGADIWQAIVKANRYQNIRINIPDTLISYNDTQYLLHTNPDTGYLEKKQDALWHEFEKKLQQDNQIFAHRFKVSNEKYPPYRKFNQHHTMSEVCDLLNYKTNPEVPFIIQRYKGKTDWLGSTLILPYSKREEKKGVEGSEFLQKYVFSKPLKSTILRLQYFTKNSSSMQANYGYRVMNRIGNFDKNSKRNIEAKCSTILDSDKDSDNYNVKMWPAKSINEFSIEVQLVKGTGLKDYEQQTAELVKLIERNNKVRISEIVCDFIQDVEGKVWFINCRSIKLESTKSMKDLLSINQQDDGDNGKGTLAQLTCSVYCKLCGIKFKKDEASKVLTYKLLWELVQHLKKRNIYLKNIKVSHKTTRPCRVCNLCYMLVVGEHELIEIEQQFAIAQNIPISDTVSTNKKGLKNQVNELNDAVIRVPIDSKPKHRPALLSEQLYQWRLIFYVIEISNIGSEHNVDFNNLYFQFKLNKFQTSFKIDPNKQGDTSNYYQNSQQQSTNQTQSQKHRQAKDNLSTVQVNKIKVHYFFSEEMDIGKFLSETEIKVRLTQGSDWNSFLAEGSSKTIHHFKNKIEGGQRHSSQVLLFFENSKYCILTLNVGLVCDKQYNTAKLNLYKYNNIYFPDENYYNSNPFPNEWCEMFDPQFVSDKDYLEDNKGTEKYSPKCSPNDLNKMIDFNSYKAKSKYKHVNSKVSQMIRVSSAKTADTQFIKGLQSETTKNFISPSLANDTGIFPSTTKNGKPPRAQTAKMMGRRNQSDGNLTFNKGKFNQSAQNRPMSNKLVPINNKNGETQSSGKFFQQDRKSESYKFLLDKNRNKTSGTEEQQVLKQYKEFEDLFSDQENDPLDDSAEEVIREKLMEHFKKVNKIDNENEQLIKSDAQKRRVQSGNIYNRKSSKDIDQQQVNREDFNTFISQKKKTLED